MNVKTKKQKVVRKNIEKYNWKQIKQVIQDIYSQDASEDSWGCKVIYLDSMLKNTKHRLKYIKQFIK
jgi:hypothetical protein